MPYVQIPRDLNKVKEKFLFGIDLPEVIDWSKVRITADNSAYDTVIRILEEIHNKWVSENAKKYDRGNETKSNKNLFQHLPTALIGIDELAKDLMFLAPMLKAAGLNVGEMDLVPYGAFKPSKEIEEAYARYVQQYKEEHNITSIENLSYHIEDCTNGSYEQINAVSPIAKARLDYMREHIDLLTNTVLDKNPAEFGILPEHNVKV